MTKTITTKHYLELLEKSEQLDKIRAKVRELEEENRELKSDLRFYRSPQNNRENDISKAHQEEKTRTYSAYYPGNSSSKSC